MTDSTHDLCVRCSEPIPAEATARKQPDGTWRCTCPKCGQVQFPPFTR